MSAGDVGFPSPIRPSPPPTTISFLFFGDNNNNDKYPAYIGISSRSLTPSAPDYYPGFGNPEKSVPRKYYSPLFAAHEMACTVQISRDDWDLQEISYKLTREFRPFPGNHLQNEMKY